MIRRSFVTIFGACLILVASFAFTQTKREATSSALTADEILDRMSKIYATCKTYQDSGTVKTKFIQKNNERLNEKSFTTAFIRPDKFRFEFREKKDYSIKEERYIIWSKGKEVLKWWDLEPGIQKQESLGMTLAGATGVSGGSAHTIPALLLSEVGGRLLTDVRDAKRIDDERLNNAKCFRIVGKYAGDSIVIWIDATSFLVRLITSEHNFPEFRTETITSYSPSVDGSISAKAMEFNPSQ